MFLVFFIWSCLLVRFGHLFRSNNWPHTKLQNTNLETLKMLSQSHCLVSFDGRKESLPRFSFFLFEILKLCFTEIVSLNLMLTIGVQNDVSNFVGGLWDGGGETISSSSYQGKKNTKFVHEYHKLYFCG